MAGGEVCLDEPYASVYDAGRDQVRVGFLLSGSGVRVCLGVSCLLAWRRMAISVEM